ncbi:MAG: HAMP domain-containing histidine kinase [Bacteriovorax sp.]|nr:HAMP domain-containing histidine kinase [Bacteriovorax sp.]
MFKEKKTHFTQKRDQFFFHDVINLTHGLILFLNERMNSKKNLENEQIKLLENELRTLQSLIKDHFHFKHKNLVESSEWVPFSVAESALKGLIQTYLPEENVKTYIRLKGKISYEQSLQERESAFVYYPVFYRVMNNLIKNMAEAKSNEVFFLFDYSDNTLFIETRNKTISDSFTWHEEGPRSSESSSGNGLGLDSIRGLALNSGGKYEIEVVDSVWINRITLPNPLSEVEPKRAA